MLVCEQCLGSGMISCPACYARYMEQSNCECTVCGKTRTVSCICCYGKGVILEKGDNRYNDDCYPKSYIMKYVDV